MRILKCKLTTIEALLGTASNNKALHSEFIASHAPMRRAVRKKLRRWVWMR